MAFCAWVSLKRPISATAQTTASHTRRCTSLSCLLDEVTLSVWHGYSGGQAAVCRQGVQKNPTCSGWGQEACTGTLSLERFIQQKIGQVSWLAALDYFLRLPKAQCLSGLRRFRSAYSCGTAMASHHLPWLQSYSVAARSNFQHMFNCGMRLS